MGNVKDYTGMTSGNGTTFLSSTGKKNKDNKILWNAICGSCGKEFEAIPAYFLGTHLYRNKSCGCVSKAANSLAIANNKYLTTTILDENGKRISIAKHRLIIEKHIGKKLLPTQNIHHKNGVRHDNRIENLEIFDTSQPSGQRPEDKLHHSYEILIHYSNNEDLVKLAKKDLEIANKLREEENNQPLVQKTLWNEEEC